MTADFIRWMLFLGRCYKVSLIYRPLDAPNKCVRFFLSVFKFVQAVN